MSETPEHLKELIASRDKPRAENPPEATDVFSTFIYFNWSWMGCGFGQLSVELDREKGEIVCENECMSRDSIRKILHAYADFIADRCVLADNPEDVAPVDYKAELIENDRAAKEWRAAQQALYKQEKKNG